MKNNLTLILLLILTLTSCSSYQYNADRVESILAVTEAGDTISVPYKKFLNDLDITIVQNKTYELLSVSSAAIVTSGTATLETALFKVPQIVCYKSSFISYIIAKLLVKIKYISLVNLIMDKEIVKELIQQNCNKDSISLELNKILNPDHRKKLLLNYSKLISVLGKPGISRRIANDIIKI